MRKSIAVLFLTAFAVASPLTAWATSIPVVNAGFEADPLVDGGATSGLQGWLFPSPNPTISAGAFNPSTASYTLEAPEGSNVGYAFDNGPAPESYLVQVLSTNVA